MYKLQVRNLKKDNNNNGTRKRFRGGEDPQPGDTNATSENPPVPANELEAAPVIESVPTNEPVPTNESVPANELEPAPTNEFESAPVDEPAPANELEAAPVDEPAPVNEFEAAPVDEPVPANELEASPVDEPAPVNEYEVPPLDESAPVNEVEAASEPSGDGPSAEIEAFRNMMGTSPETQEVYLYLNTNISTEENRDKSYKREGVLHFTDSVSVGANQTTVMSLGSVIGNRGIETTTYDKLRNVALQKVGILLGENRRCYNTKFDFERNGETILVHIYGTVYSKKSEQPIM